MIFSVLSLNTWQERGPWEKRWEVIHERISSLRPDILAFQELFKPDWAEHVRVRSSKVEIAVFPEHSSGLVLMTNFALEKKEILRYETASPNEHYFRYAVFARVSTEAGPLHLFNTHLSWQPDDREVRKEQLKELVRWIDGKGEAPVIVTGDFNADAGSPELGVMLEAGFRDACSVCTPGKEKVTWSHRNPFTHSDVNKFEGGLLPERRIDFIFFRGAGRLMPMDMDVIFDTPSDEGIWASDHFGLFARFRLEEP